jgi:predicted nucleotidyltransferase component of viral defense system
MISDHEIETKAAEFLLRPLDVQKDYVYGWLLKGLFQRPALAGQLILKGGNALRKGYLPETRFSKDLDFSVRQTLTQPILESELREVCDFVSEQTGVKFIDKVSIRQKDLAIPDIVALEARLYFRSFYGEENLKLRTQLDITQFDRVYLPVQNRQLLHPYSDADACTTTIACHKLEEILASKLTTLLHRRHAADLFDLLYTIVFRDQFGVNRREIITTFLKKSIFEREPVVARDQLRAVPMTDFQDLWKSLVAPVASLFNFDFVVANFQGLVDSLFSLVIVPSPASVPIGATPPTITRSSTGFGRPLGIGYQNYFSSDIRNSIINAGRARSLTRLIPMK